MKQTTEIAEPDRPGQEYSVGIVSGVGASWAMVEQAALAVRETIGDTLDLGTLDRGAVASAVADVMRLHSRDDSGEPAPAHADLREKYPSYNYNAVTPLWFETPAGWTRTLGVTRGNLLNYAGHIEYIRGRANTAYRLMESYTEKRERETGNTRLSQFSGYAEEDGEPSRQMVRAFPVLNFDEIVAGATGPDMVTPGSFLDESAHFLRTFRADYLMAAGGGKTFEPPQPDREWDNGGAMAPEVHAALKELPYPWWNIIAYYYDDEYNLVPCLDDRSIRAFAEFAGYHRISAATAFNRARRYAQEYPEMTGEPFRDMHRSKFGYGMERAENVLPVHHLINPEDSRMSRVLRGFGPRSAELFRQLEGGLAPLVVAGRLPVIPAARDK